MTPERMTHPRKPSMLLAAALSVVLGTGLVATLPAGAKSSDRNQPMDLASDRSSCGVDDTGACEFTGNVQISQGTLRINAARATLHRVDGDVSRAVLCAHRHSASSESDARRPG